MKKHKQAPCDAHGNLTKAVRCDWLNCAGGMGLAGNGMCSFRGDWSRVHCPDFIRNDDYEREGENRNLLVQILQETANGGRLRESTKQRIREFLK